MQIERTYTLIEDENGTLYRVAATEEAQQQALNLLVEKDTGELPILRDRSTKIVAVNLDKLAKKHKGNTYKFKQSKGAKKE